MATALSHHDVARSWTVIFGLALALALALLPAWPAPAQAQQEQDRAGLEHACPEGEVPDSGFTDTRGNIHERSIDCAAWWEITQGGPGVLPASQYGPTLPVYRDQMASFIARLIDESDGEELPAWDRENRFTDVSDESVHVANINRLAEAGIVLGRTATEYAPRMVVRRDQMASFIARAIHHVTGTDRATNDDQFTDVEQDNVHRRNINGLAVEGVVRGIGGGRYAPAVQVRRDAMASFVMRGMDLHVEEGFATPPGETGPPTPDPTPTPTPDPADDPEPASTTQSVTLAPELLSVETVSGATDPVTVRFTFDKTLRSEDVDAEGFYLYGIDTNRQRFQASNAERTAATAVTATFTLRQYVQATTAGVATGAVQDLGERSNPERSLGLRGQSYPPTITIAPNLVSVGGFVQSGADALVNFQFDRVVTAAETSTDPTGRFGIVLADGTEINGPATAAEPNNTTVTVRFAGRTASTLQAQTRRAFTRAGAVQHGNLSNPLRAIHVGDGTLTTLPNLVGITLNPAAHQVVYRFDQPIADGPTTAPSAGGFQVFYVDGRQRDGSGGLPLAPTPPTVSADGLRVTVTFAEGSINANVVGATARSGAVQSGQGPNRTETLGVAATRSFAQGTVLGPRLVGASKTAANTGFMVTWRFDRDVANLSSSGLAVYTPAGARVTATPSSAGVINPTTCSASGRAVTCLVMAPPGTDFVLAAVEHNTVTTDGAQTGSGTNFPNYEQARAL